MFRKFMGAALVSTAAVIAGPALAGPGGGHSAAPAGAKAGAMIAPARTTTTTRATTRATTQAPLRAAPRATVRSSTRSAVRTAGSTTRTHATVRSTHRVGARASANASLGANSQSLMHASFRAIERASPKSSLARGAVAAGTLPGLDTGLTVKGNGGATIGTVSRVVTGTDGKIRLVVATSPTGRTIRLVPNTLSISGGVVTTTAQ